MLEYKYIPLESTCYLFVAYYQEFRNRESYEGFVLTVYRELLKYTIWVIKHEKKLREFFLFIKLFVVTKMEIPKNVLKRVTTYCYYVSQHILPSGSDGTY